MAAVAQLSKNVQISGASLFPRIGLSMVIDKYIGETAKYLSRIFEEGTNIFGILVFDEIGVLFDKRTEVRSAGDYCANLEISDLP